MPEASLLIYQGAKLISRIGETLGKTSLNTQKNLSVLEPCRLSCNAFFSILPLILLLTATGPALRGIIFCLSSEMSFMFSDKKEERGELPKAGTGNASNPTPEDQETSAGPDQLIDKQGEKYLREVASPEDYPDAEQRKELDE